MSKVSVVVPVFNKAYLTKRFIDSLFAGSRLVHEVIVIDNASSDETPELLVELKKKAEARGWKFEIIRNAENVGYGRAMNQGIRVARGDFVALANNDTWLMPGWDEALARRATELRASMVGPMLDETSFDETRMVERAEKSVKKNRGRRLREFVPVLMFFKKEALDRIGEFDERFFLTYEDADLHWRMNSMKEPYFSVGDCYVWHHSKGTRGEMPTSYEIEGKRLFMEKWGFDPTLWEHTLRGRLKRRWQKIRRKYGYL